LFGATGATGRLVLGQLLEQGFDVKVLVSDPSKLTVEDERLSVVKGDMEDPDSIGRAISGCDAVIVTLGVRSNSAAEVTRLLGITDSIIASMKRNRVRRFIGVAGASVEVRGDRKGAGYRIVSSLSRLTSRHVVEEKQKEYDRVSGSGLDWTILRVPFITEGPLTKKGRLSLTSPPSSRISRQDIAYALVGQLKDQVYVRKAPFLAD
jgi:putative NADH-flavin reductase